MKNFISQNESQSKDIHRHTVLFTKLNVLIFDKAKQMGKNVFVTHVSWNICASMHIPKVLISFDIIMWICGQCQMQCEQNSFQLGYLE